MNKFSRQRAVQPAASRLIRGHRGSIVKAAVGRSLRDFQPLLPGEESLLHACRQGEMALLGHEVPQAPNDELRVRAPFLRFLLLGGDEEAPIHEHGVQLAGAFVEGQLDLAGCSIPHNIDLKHCQFTDLLLAQDARVQGLMTLQGSCLSLGINADRLQCDGGLFLRHGFKSTGEARLLGAQIGGNLDCSGGQFEVKEGDALSVDRAVIKGSAFLDDGFKATGEVRLLGAQIGGNLACSSGQFEVKQGNALSADGAVVKGDVFFTDGFKVTGEVRLLGAQIGGDLACRSGQFEVKQGSALSADRAVVKGDVFFTDGFKATGEVRLLGAQIGGDLACRGGQFDVRDGVALSAERAVVKGSVFLDGDFKATGKVRLLGTQIGSNLECSRGQFEVTEGYALSADSVDVKGGVFFTDGFKVTGALRLLGAQIGGNLDCSGGQFEVKEGDALSADGAVVKGDVFLHDGFKATGEVRLLGVQIGGNLECSRGQFEVTEGYALSADRLVVKGGVFFTDGFKATGGVRLLGAQIGGNLTCRDGQFEVKEGNALSVENATVEGAWLFCELTQPVRVNASHVQVAVLVDAIESWAEGSVLDGLRYGALGGAAPTQATTRLKWLCKQRAGHLGGTDGGEDFRPQPWRQLQRVLRDMGHAEEARQIGIAFEQQLRKAGRIGSTAPGTWAIAARGKRTIANAGHALFGWLAGYGYRPMRLMFGMALVWLICGISYWFLALPPHHAIGPSDPLVFQNERYAACVPGSPAATSAVTSGVRHAGNWYLCESLPAEYSTFSPLVYSLDILLPLVDLGQEKAWGPLVPTPQQKFWREGLALSPGHLVRFLVWFETLFGWIGGLLLAGIVSGFARRTED